MPRFALIILAALLALPLAAAPPAPPALVQRAREAMSRNDGPAAVRLLLDALKADPQQTDALYFLAKLSNVLAQQEFQRLYKLAPDSAAVHLLTAEMHHARQDAAGEEREYRAALAQDPRLVAALTALADLERETNRCPDAIGLYQRAAALVPRDFDALFGQAACAVSNRDYAAAIPLFRRALQVDPKSLAALIALGNALHHEGQAAEAVRLLEQVVARVPTAKQAWAVLARSYQILGLEQKSAAAFETFRRLSDDELSALHEEYLKK